MAARFGFLPVPAEMARKYLDKSAEVVPIFDRQLGRHRFLAGESLTAADLFLYPLYAYFPDIAELRAIADKAPNCARWAREMATRPSVQSTEPAFKPRIAA
jgi:glutathione S-transferase